MLFRLSEINKSYGGREILRGLSFQVNRDEKIGLVGRNGAGKTTVFRVLSGEEAPDSGEVIKANNLKLGFLEQHVEFSADLTVHEAALSAFEKLQNIEIEMRRLETAMSENPPDLDKVLEKYSTLQHEFEREGGFEYAARAESVLQGLGFDREMWNQTADKLSGGQRNRLGLVRLLLAEPDVLLLDEPTNHLDVNSVEWLEEFLQTYASSYIAISHDRYFLDRVCNRIIEIEHGKAVSYSGNYSAFLIEREERREAQRRAFENQQQLIAKTEDFIRRNIAGQKTKMAKSRRNMLERLERVDTVTVDKSAGDFKLKNVERAGNNVLMVEDLSVGFPDKTLAENINFTLRRGECLGIIGANGTGKTTFLKTVLGKLRPLDGEARWGTKTEIGYYAQQLDDLDDRNEIIMELRRVAASTVTNGELRSFLGKFLFTGEDVFKRVGDLSGGEKGRLALAKLIYTECNVLVLDEPTNHLDIPSREALEAALEAYPGTILTISHDRYFLDRVATQILFFDGKGKTEHYNGNYSEFHEWQASIISRRSSAAESEKEKVSQPGKEKQQTAKKEQRIKTKLRAPEIIEEEIAAIETKLALLTSQMSQPEIASNPQKFAEISALYQKAESDLEKLMEEWEMSSTTVG
ncbi:MAG TPA: ABC-F family ATP-binding cassette domain-containing protein [Pyrinomonadaceae bacterium]|jgi:ATP-binding cassette subfamily F protein 3